MFSIYMKLLLSSLLLSSINLTTCLYRNSRYLKMSSFTATRLSDANPRSITLQQTMLRIKDPMKSVEFYTKHFGFKLIHQYDFAEWNFSLYFLAILPEYLTAPTCGTKESEDFLWDLPIGVSTLELTHNYGSENDESFTVNNGNVEPYRGFGHIAVMTPDVYAASEELEKNGIITITITITIIYYINNHHVNQE